MRNWSKGAEQSKNSDVAKRLRHRTLTPAFVGSNPTIAVEYERKMQNETTVYKIER